MRQHAMKTGKAFTVSLTLAFCFLAASLFAHVQPANAQRAYPERPVRVIVPFGPGGVGDVLARLVSDRLSEKLGQRFVVENFPGPGGINAAQVVLRAPADGYTIAYLASATAMSVNLFQKLPYDPIKDFEPVSSLGYFSLTFVTSVKSPYKTLEDFIKAAKDKPGALNVGTILIGSTQNLGVELLKSTLDMDFVIVPHRNSGEVLVSLQRGDVQLAAEFYPPLRGGLEAKRFIPVGTSGAKRAAYLPDVPTMMEAGAKGFEMTSWSGLFVRRGTPQEPIKVLNTALREVLAEPDVVKRALELGIEAAPSSPQELQERLAEEIPKWRRVIDNAKIKRK